MPDIESPPKNPPEIFSMGSRSREVSPEMVTDFDREINGVYVTVEDKNESNSSRTVSLDIDHYQPVKIVPTSKGGSSYNPLKSKRNS